MSRHKEPTFFNTCMHVSMNVSISSGKIKKTKKRTTKNCLSTVYANFKFKKLKLETFANTWYIRSDCYLLSERQEVRDIFGLSCIYKRQKIYYSLRVYPVLMHSHVTLQTCCWRTYFVTKLTEFPCKSWWLTANEDCLGCFIVMIY